MDTSDTLDGTLYESESAKKGVEYMHTASVVIGALSIIFSLVFIWNATELGIILCCGRKLEDSCLCEKIVKEEMRVILNEKVWDSEMWPIKNAKYDPS